MKPPNSPQSANNPFAFIDTTYGVVMLVAKTISMTMDVFLRSNFGVRYFGFAGVFTSIAIGFLMIFMLSIIDSLGGTAAEITETIKDPLNTGAAVDTMLGRPVGELTLPDAPQVPLYPRFVLGVVILTAAHQLIAWRRHQRGEYWHSRYSGTPHFFWFLIPTPFGPLPEHIVKRGLEPLLVWGIATLVKPLDPALSFYLSFAAVALLVRANFEHYFSKKRLLDVLDEQLDAQMFNAAILEAKQPRECRGSMYAGLITANTETETREKVIRIAKQELEPEYMDLITSSTPTSAAAAAESSAGSDDFNHLLDGEPPSES